MTRRELLWGMAGAAAAQSTSADWSKIAAEGIGHLRDYIRVNTSNPPGDVAPACDFLSRLLEKEGIPTERFASSPPKVNLLARLRSNGSKRPLLLLNHTDTVPADRSRWSRDPFGGEMADGRVWGRGTVDMKSTGILHLMAMLLLKRNRVPLNRDVIFAATSDEEVGGNGVKFLLEKHAARVESEYVLEEGGFSSTNLFAPTEVHGVSVAQKQVLWLHLTVEGTGGHGSQPTDDNAIGLLSRVMRRIIEMPPPKRVEPILDQMLSRLGGPLASNRFANAIQRNTISLTSFRAGVGEPPKDNVIPSLATASIDCRLLPSQSVDEFIDWMKRSAGEPKLRVEKAHHQPSEPPSRTDTELFRLIDATVKRHAPLARIIPYLTPFGTDGNFFRRPDRNVYGFFPVVLTADEIMSMHSDAERMPVAPFAKGLQMFYEVVAGIAA